MAAATIEGLPEELMTLILAKLPVKSLLRCKRVKKSWYSLIQSPQFIRLHHRSSSPSPQFIFTLCVGDKPEQFDEESEPSEEEPAEPFEEEPEPSEEEPEQFEEEPDDPIEEEPAEPFDIEEKPEPMDFSEDPRHVISFYSYETLEHLGGINNDIHIPLSNPYGAVSLTGSCDGLVCITNHFDTDYGTPYDTDQILICNPATREWRSLFVPPASGYRVKSVAFGSDPSTGQYKVVMIGIPRDRCDREENLYANVYDFSTDSWRETGVVFPAPFCYSPRAVSLNGAFHWYGSSDILTFHMSDEVAGSIPTPEFVSDYSLKELYVSSKSQLSLVFYIWEGEDRFEIFVMTEYGVKESWTRLFKIGPMSNVPIREPFAFWDEQQQLLFLERKQLFSWELQHQNQLWYFPICWTSCGLKPNTNTLVSYSESLVSVRSMGFE